MFIRRSALIGFLTLMGIMVFRPVVAQEVPTTLNYGMVVADYVDTSNMSDWYHFDAAPDSSVFLLVISNRNDEGPAIVISNANTNQNIATTQMGVIGFCLRFAPSEEGYTMTVNADHPDAQQWYGIVLESGDPDEQLCPEAMTSAITTLLDTEPTGTTIASLDGESGDLVSDVTDTELVTNVDLSPQYECDASSGGDVGVRVRALNSLDSDIIGRIGVNSLVPVIGATQDMSWLLVNLGDTVGFASSSVLDISGNCGAVPVVSVLDNSANGTGDRIDLTTVLSLDSNPGGLDVEVAGVGDINVSTDDGLDVDADVAGVVGVDTSLGGDEGVGVGVNVGDQPILDVQLGGDNPDSPICVNLLGIRIAC